MSKKSVVRGVRGWKLAAVAALVVAGVVGTVWAVIPTVGSAAYDKMSAVFKVERILNITCNGKNPDKNVLLATDVSLQAFAQQDPGTLGTIKVNTNSAGWDVLMTTDNGGRLIYKTGGSPGPQQCPGGTDPWDNKKCPGGWQPGPIVGAVTTPLLYSTQSQATQSGRIGGTTSTDYDTVQLEVSIGLAFLGSQLSESAPQGNMYAIGAPTNFVLPVIVPYTSLEPSGTQYGSNAGVSTISIADRAISFASLIAGTSTTGYGTTTPTPNLNGQTWTDIVTNGFKAPNQPLAPVDEQYFFVNVGLNQTLKPQIGGNDDGEYTETFTFTLAANF